MLVSSVVGKGIMFFEARGRRTGIVFIGFALSGVV